MFLVKQHNLYSQPGIQRRRIKKTRAPSSNQEQSKKIVKPIKIANRRYTSRGKRSAMTWAEIKAWRNSWDKKTTRLSFYHNQITTRSPRILFNKNQKTKHKPNQLQGYGSKSVSTSASSTTNMNNMINSFLSSVIQTYGHGQAIKIPGNKYQGQPQMSYAGSVNTQKVQSASIGAKIFRRLRKFSKKSVENMMKMPNFGKSIPLANVKSPQSSNIPWVTLKRVLTKGIRGPDVARWYKHISLVTVRY